MFLLLLHAAVSEGVCVNEKLIGFRSHERHLESLAFKHELFEYPMLMLSTPFSQSRLNAAVLEIIGLRISGPVGIPGVWDAEETRQYVERKTRRTVLMAGDGRVFCTDGKHVEFSAFRVVISPEV